jgi:hypothetical protein
VKEGDLAQVTSEFRPMAGRAGRVTQVDEGEETVYWLDHGFDKLKYNEFQITKLEEDN